MHTSATNMIGDTRHLSNVLSLPSKTSRETCVITCLARAFNFTALTEKLPANIKAQFQRAVVIIDHRDGWSMFYPYGVAVHWNVALEDRQWLNTLLLRVADKPHAQALEETYAYTTNRPQTRIHQDHIELQSADQKILLALSHTMAQSIKLAEFEAQAVYTIESTHHLPKSLAQQGHIKLGRRDIAKIRGKLFLAKSDIFLNYGMLETPEFFWDHPEYEPVYQLAANYLEIPRRTEILSKKLETIRELLEMLADEQKHRHSSNLEWTVIWLIVAEIVISLGEKLF